MAFELRVERCADKIMLLARCVAMDSYQQAKYGSYLAVCKHTCRFLTAISMVPLAYTNRIKSYRLKKWRRMNNSMRKSNSFKKEWTMNWRSIAKRQRKDS